MDKRLNYDDLKKRYLNDESYMIDNFVEDIKELIVCDLEDFEFQECTGLTKDSGYEEGVHEVIRYLKLYINP